jgi:hypothetical protein
MERILELQISIAIEIIRKYLKIISDEERLSIFRDIEEGYCTYCGGSELPCFCLRDE